MEPVFPGGAGTMLGPLMGGWLMASPYTQQECP